MKSKLNAVESGTVSARLYASRQAAKAVELQRLVGFEADFKLIEQQIFESYLAGYLGRALEKK